MLDRLWVLFLCGGLVMAVQAGGASHRTSDSIMIAVASNFQPTLGQIASRFEKQTGKHIRISSGSTGKFFQQIKQGAPYDIYFAADEQHPKLLVREGFALADTRFTYAIGKLVLWAPGQDIQKEAKPILSKGNFNYLAIANPGIAPYGKAAAEILEKLGLWSTLQTRIVRAENVNQAKNFVVTHNADLGFVALSQVNHLRHSPEVWVVPQTLYQPIQQQVVILMHAKNNKAAEQFLQFLQEKSIKTLIRNSGYEVS